MNTKFLAAAAVFATSQAVNLKAQVGLGQFFLPGEDYYHVDTFEQFKIGLEA